MFLVSFCVASSLQNGQDSIKFSTTLITTLRIKSSHMRIGAIYFPWSYSHIIKRYKWSSTVVKSWNGKRICLNKVNYIVSVT
jgi:hypothetical protein